jgi:hypothetical protein
LSDTPAEVGRDRAGLHLPRSFTPLGERAELELDAGRVGTDTEKRRFAAQASR